MDRPSPPPLTALRHRARTDFRFAVYLAFAAVALLVLGGLTVVRALQGAWAYVLLDGTLTLLVAGAAWHAIRGGAPERAAPIIASMAVVGAIVAVLLGPSGVFWAYPAALAVAFLCPPRWGLLMVAALLLALVLQGDYLAGTGQPLSVLGSLAVSATFGFLFAHRSQASRSELEQLATRDALTGAGNRRAFEVELSMAVALAARDGRPVALALLDLDHFKRVNDEFGHAGGDDVLRAFAGLVEATVRRTDRLFRIGGEEFALLLPATGLVGLATGMGHVQEAVRLRLRAQQRAVTCSIGAAVLAPGEDVEAWFRRADRALYRAKAAGRDRTVVDAADAA